MYEIKLFSPTHVFFFVHNNKTDSFVVAGAGTYTTKDSQYLETLQFANFEFNPDGYRLSQKVIADTFYQSGISTNTDGTQTPNYHKFIKLKSLKEYNGPHVGTWSQVSSSYQEADGTSGSTTSATHTRYQLITPTHWMRINMKGKNFESAFGGTYTLKDNQVLLRIEFASVPQLKGVTSTIAQRLDNNKLYWSGKVTDNSGKVVSQYTDVFERASPLPVRVTR
jgi:hypothetical protein